MWLHLIEMERALALTIRDQTTPDSLVGRARYIVPVSWSAESLPNFGGALLALLERLGRLDR
jgi:hypothetical protein